MAEIGNRREEFNQLLEEIAKELHAIAVKKYKAELKKTGNEYSGELRKNFEIGLIKITRDISAEIVFSFGKYGRWRDLKYVEYFGYKKPNNRGKKYGDPEAKDEETPEQVLIFEDWIAKRGLSRFKYVQGYIGSNSRPITDRAIKRMAWGMFLGRMWKGKIQNKKTQWYAKTTPKIIKEARPMLTERIVKMLTDGTYSRAWEDII